MDFSTALILAKQGAKICRSGWNGKGQFVTSQYPDAGSQNTVPYLWLKNAQGDRVPWVPSQGDLFVQDWEVL
jgi:hypothetical protein